MSEQTKLPFEGDEDVKIAVPSKKKDTDSVKEKNELLEQLNKADEDGKIVLAKELGKEIAEKIASCEGEFSCASNFEQEILFQCRLLFLFSVTVGSERYMPNTILAMTLINSCHDEVNRICPDLFRPEGNYSTALSFYYLAVRGSTDVESEIGKTFAMICGKAGDPDFENLGTTLFERCTKYIKDRAEKFLD